MAGARYYKRKDFSFILTDKRTIVSTSHQTFVVKHDHRNYIKQLERLRAMVIKGEINSLSELITFCSFKPGGYRDQMCGLELVSTKLERYL